VEPAVTPPLIAQAQPRDPACALPVGAWDCHTHIFGPWDRFPLPAAPAYQPDEAGFDTLRQLHGHLGIARGVLVQAAAYGADHSALLAALHAGENAYRGIVLLEPDIEEAILADLFKAGVRGARLNVVAHLPGGTDPGRMRAIAERIRPHGGHLLIHGRLSEVLLALRALSGCDVPVVVDHMARVEAARGTTYPEFAELEAHLAAPHVWIKLSGADRISRGVPPFDDAVPVARRLLEIAPTRALWGSDWPHPNITTPWPDEAALLDLLEQICGERSSLERVLVTNPLTLYR
jgi:2-pyrone-4,6-dicarboxylate lactonase